MAEIKISGLTSAPVTPTGTEVFAVVQGSTTHKTTIDSLKPALVDNLSAGAPTWDVNGNLTAGYDIIAGGNHAGKVALTINDGYGNANLTFNHTDGIPDVSGSSARIAVSVDSNQEVMEFQLKGSVTAGSALSLTSVLKLYDDGIQLLQATTCLTPTQNTHVARKDYVDDLLATKATTASVTAVSSSLTNHLNAITSHTKAQVGLSNVNNTSDANKPISTATQTALDGKIGESEINTGDFTFANNTLSLNTIVEGQIGELQISAGKIKNYAITANKLKGTESIAQGDFLIYDAVTDGFETTSSTSETHKLFSPNHTDVASNVTPSYGDSMYYNGTEWTTGNFGNYGADMEYVAVTLGTENLIKSGVNNSSGDIVYNVADFEGIGLQNSNIRGIYVYIYADFNGDDGATFSATMPDGVFTKIGQYDGDLGNGAQAGAHTVFVPINEGQESITINQVINRQAHTLNWRWEIKGVQCTKRVALSPDVDVILIKGSQSHLDMDLGYVAAGVDQYYQAANDIWASTDEYAALLAQGTGVGGNWNGVFPITIPDNVSKTVIRAINNWNVPSGTGESHSSEEIDHITIVIDWNAGTIRGTYVWSAEAHQTGRLSSDDLIGEKQFYTDTSAYFLAQDHDNPLIKFEINGRDIIKLPCPYHGAALGTAGVYHNVGQSYTIENYKTNATSTYEPYDSSFGMFFDSPNHQSYSTFFGSSYISKDGSFIFSGGGGTYVLNGSSPAKQASYTRVQLPLEVGEKVVEYYYSGDNHCTAFLLTDRGNVFGAGYGGTGQLGQGNLLGQTTFTKIISDVAFLSVGNGNTHYAHCLAIKNNGTAWSWGNNRANELGRGTPANHTSVVNQSPGQIPGFGTTGKIAKKAFAFNSVNHGKSFIITEDRKIWACGSAYDGGLGLAAATATFTDTGRVGDYMTANSTDANKSVFIVDGTDLWAAGDNAYGQLGLGNTAANKADKYLFEQVPNISVAQISVSGTNCSTAVLETDGSLKTWGYNANGQLGLGDLIQRGTPVDSGLGTDIKKVKLFGPDSYNAIYVLKNDGTVWVSGYNGYGQLGLGDTTSRSAFTKMAKDDKIFIKDFQLFGYNSQNAFVGADQYDNLWGCGENSTYRMLSTTNDIAVDRSTLTQIDSIASRVAESTVTEYVDGVTSAGENGYTQLPGGIIMQWGTLTPSTQLTDVTLPITFPNACLNVQASIGADFADTLYSDNSLIWGGYPTSTAPRSKVTIMSNLRLSNTGVTYRKIFWTATGH